MLDRLKKIPHAMLLIGECEKELSAFLSSHFSKKEHPDIHHYFPEGKSGTHPIESLKKLQADAALVPFDAQYKCFIIHDAERMLPTSANALLKTLEEPPAKTVLILLVSDERALLPTVRSRCQTFRFPPKAKDKEPLLEELHRAVLGDREAIGEIDAALERERKSWEKELLSTLPKEISAVQKESYIKEIEGTLALRYQTRVFSLFETVLIWQRDAIAKRVGSPYILSNKEVPFRPLSALIQAVERGRLAIQRGMKLSAALYYILS